MLLSMTGYGKAVCEYQHKKIIAELKSLNSKQIDILARIPSAYREKEIELRSLVAQRLVRGKVDFQITIDNNSGAEAVTINQSVVQNYFQQLCEMSRKSGIPMPTTANYFDTILRLPEALCVSANEVDENEYAAVFQAVNAAIDQLLAFRAQEGESLQRMFSEKLDNIARLLAEVETREKTRVPAIRARIEEGLKELGDKVQVDRNRFEQELIFYIEKLDINEEKVRLRNHLKYFAETMKNDDAAGKKLGFIAQEMGREINTLGSKSNQSEMQILVVKMKDELEQIKEQVLNVL